MMTKTQFIDVGQGETARKIALRRREGKAPGLVWLGGYRSDMVGTKAEALDEWARTNGYACCRHDYSGHGESGGKFIDGTISRWLEESLCVFEAFTQGPSQDPNQGPQILTGSSMGAWIALRMAEELKKAGKSERIKGMVLIAPAPDFTHELMWPKLDEAQKRQIEQNGYLEQMSEYSPEPNIFTKALFDDGQKNLVMKGPIALGCKVHILQGMQDEDVPFVHAQKLAELLPEDNVTMTLIKDGDHRLSREADIALLLRSVEAMMG